MKVEIFDDYKKVVPEEGCVLTEYKEGDEVYTYCKSMYTPLSTDLSKLRDITLEEHHILEEKFKNKEDILH
jgi:hypothetical protein